VARPEAALNRAAHALQRRSRNDTFGTAADAPQHVNTALWACCRDRCRDIAVADEADSGASCPDLGDELRVTRSVKHDHRDVFDRLLQRF
jgi:hypothetical protein